MSDTSAKFDQLAIVGVGLIGGSIALAAKRSGAAQRVIGFGRNQERLNAALSTQVIDDVATSPEQLAQAQLIIVCTPVDRIAGDVLQALAATQATGSLITDVGSVKGRILDDVQAQSKEHRFVGAHPLAGSHRSGFEYATADLFRSRLCLVTPETGRENSTETKRITAFWQQIGMRVHLMSAEEHDRILALTSHLPHLAASVIAGLVPPEYLGFAATGYRDTTRVAAGDPELWSAILSLNAPAMIDGIDEMITLLQQYREQILSGKQQGLVSLLEKARQNRKQYLDDLIHPDDGT